MLDMVQRLANDTVALNRVVGPRVTARWLFEIARNLPECVRKHNLTPADVAMGKGPFDVRMGSARARLQGSWVMGGIREIWARDVYLGGGFLHISNGDVVVDLGMNAGNFTALALGHGPDVRVVCCEPNPMFVDRLHRNLELNGWHGRAQLFRAFIGGVTATQEDLQSRPGLEQIPTISEDDFIAQGQLTRIDFLKCDIEGSEFALFGGKSRLLGMARQVGIEIHKHAGDAQQLIETIRASGFEIKLVSEDSKGLILLGRRPS